MAHPEARPTEERVSTVDEIRISPAGERFYAAASEANHTHPGRAERDCSFCLEGWVFLGSIDHDGWEVFEAYPVSQVRRHGPDRSPLSLTPTWGLLRRLQATLPVSPL
jgi:hypothetical protein